MKTVTLSEAKGLVSLNKRFFAEFILERSEGLRMTFVYSHSFQLAKSELKKE